MLRLLTLTVLFLVSFHSINAQSTRVTFKITNTKNEGIPFATITVISVPDTVNKQQRVTDSTGTAVFQLQQSKPYHIQVSSVNYSLLEKALTVKGDNPVYTYI